MLKINSYAKLNLSLEVIRKYNDGYHEIKSIMQTIDLHDCLEFYPSDSININVVGQNIPIENNLIYKTIINLKNLYLVNQGIGVKVIKNIPLAAGFGGGSSNAAATILALNKLWKLNLTIDEMIAIGIKLGSDVPYFLFQGTALVEGRGEKVTPLLDVNLDDILIITTYDHIISNKTEKMFKYLTKNDYSNGDITNNLIKKINNKSLISNRDIYNIFNDLSFKSYKFMNHLLLVLNKFGISNFNICGSGPSIFIIIDDKGIISKLKKNKYLNNYKIFLVKSNKGISKVKYDN
ncbi:MAG: 4-(cytidine 5'-diphospho)-2-C-methyl-D-erythritol kinase [SAR202 cluster bacterium]|nr:4-(cytidine 5'-diphospho)-2-C-methyl-D-erythritol kinase [SAR202 cluster bacterium]